MRCPLICPNCTGKIDNYDEKAGKGVCPYCGSVVTGFIGETQKIAESSSAWERLAANAAQFVRLKDYDKATKLTNNIPKTTADGWG